MTEDSSSERTRGLSGWVDRAKGLFRRSQPETIVHPPPSQIQIEMDQIRTEFMSGTDQLREQAVEDHLNGIRARLIMLPELRNRVKYLGLDPRLFSLREPKSPKGLNSDQQVAVVLLDLAMASYADPDFQQKGKDILDELGLAEIARQKKVVQERGAKLEAVDPTKEKRPDFTDSLKGTSFEDFIGSEDAKKD